MENIRNWLVPALLTTAQAALWPGYELLRGEPVGGLRLLAAAIVAALVTVALGLRHSGPVVALATVVAVCAVGPSVTSPDALTVYGTVGVGFALYSVAVRHDTPTTVVVTATLVAWQLLWGIALHTVGQGQGVDIALTAIGYALAVGLGAGRRRWLDGRQAAARRLAGAERERRLTADAERHRLARELHDVSAHQLTSVVVTVAAARRLSDRRPELVAEATEFAATTGRETLATLRRLVTVMRTVQEGDQQDGDATARIEELAAGFGRLGQPVTVDLDRDVAGGLGGEPGEAAFGIVREALTNTLRYAPGAAVRVRGRRHGELLEVVVENDGAPQLADGAAKGLGSGRGIAGMLERARSVGGLLTAGPYEGGWRVRAELPEYGAHSADGPRRRVPKHRVAEVVAALVLVLNPFVPAFADYDQGVSSGGSPDTSALFVLIVAVHGLPLLARRRAPWTVLGAVLAAAWLWPLAASLDALPGSALVVLPFALLPGAATVYAVAAHGRGSTPTWAAIPVAVGGYLPVLLLAFPAAGAILTVLFGAAWWAGRTARERRERVRTREDAALAGAIREAVTAAYAERRRIAAGLRGTVLERAGRVVELAEDTRSEGPDTPVATDLDAITAQARSALAAMRELLGTLREAEPLALRFPQPTSAALDLLCRQHRAAGREVTLHGPAEEPPELPTDVDLAAFRVVEAALGAGDTGPARVVLEHGEDELGIRVTGVPRATADPVRERLDVQTGAVGGRFTADPSGTVQIWLPTSVGQPPVEEGSPSPFA